MTHSPKNKILLTAGFLVLLAVFVALGTSYRYFLDARGEQTPSSTSTYGSDERPADARPAQIDSRTESSKAMPKPPPAVRVSRADREKHRLWEEMHGYIRDSFERYEALDIASLEALAESGDIGAIQYLANKTLTTDPVKTLQNYELAAVHGSTAALLFTADTLLFHTREGGLLHESDQEFAAPFAALVFALTAQLRGDNVAAPVKVRELLEKHQYPQAVMDLACDNARRKIDELEQRRIAAGLNHFDNVVSPLGETFIQGNYADFPCSANPCSTGAAWAPAAACTAP